MISRIKKSFWIACLLAFPLSISASAGASINVTPSELSLHPRDFDGQLVRVTAVLIFGWEGDNFLLEPTKPKPLSTPSRDPVSIWFYWKPGQEKQVYPNAGSVYGTFEGYFHLVHEKRIVNGVFELGPLQFEAVEASIPDPQPSSLASATIRGDVDEIRRLLDPDTRQKYGSILLVLAAQVGRADFAQELLFRGADPNFTDANGDTSLMSAAWNCKLEVASALLSHGALASATNVQGETPLMLAAQTCADGKMVRILLTAGAEPNARMRNGFTALIAAAGNPLNVEELLKAGADPSARTASGATAETESCDRGEKGHYEVCQLVREALKQKAARSDK